jgi:hypothetical protein
MFLNLEQVGSRISQFKDNFVFAFGATREPLILKQNDFMRETMRGMGDSVNARFWNGIAGAVAFHIVLRLYHYRILKTLQCKNGFQRDWRTSFRVLGSTSACGFV